MQLTKKIQRGLSLIELLIGIAISLVLVGALTATFVSVSSTHVNQDKVTALEEELSAAMDLMVREIRRAGFSRNAINGVYTIDTDGLTLTENPFQNIHILSGATLTSNADASGDCVLFFYDETQDNNTALSSSDYGGFKIAVNANNVDVIHRRVSGNAGSASSCSNGSEWQEVTSDWSIETLTASFEMDVISTVTVPVTLSGGALTVKVQPRNVKIQLTGTDSDTDPPITRTITETVHVRNHRVWAE